MTQVCHDSRHSNLDRHLVRIHSTEVILLIYAYSTKPESPTSTKHLQKRNCCFE